VNVVLPDPLSPATPIVKTIGDRAMISLKFGKADMPTVPTYDNSLLRPSESTV
jgi:hypothetical protein